MQSFRGKHEAIMRGDRGRIFAIFPFGNRLPRPRPFLDSYPRKKFLLCETFVSAPSPLLHCCILPKFTTTHTTPLPASIGHLYCRLFGTLVKVNATWQIISPRAEPTCFNGTTIMTGGCSFNKNE